MLALLLLPMGLVGCESTYYGWWEKMGWHKRDLLVDAVKEGREDQQEAKEQFQTALEKLQQIVKTDGGNLQKQYDVLKGELDDSSAKAQAVSDRIKEIDDIAQDLFSEWEKELDQYSSATLKRSSQEKLQQTRSRYRELIAAMRRAESKMKPVLAALQDQTLYLKHNLNARAVAALEGEVATLETEVATLIREMESAIREADQFIQEMDTAK